jgi:hypothetical protein
MGALIGQALAEDGLTQAEFAPGSQRKIDGPNLAATVKPAVDALQDAGIVPGDDARYVTERPVQLVYDTGPRRAWLVVEATDRPETEEQQ